MHVDGKQNALCSGNLVTHICRVWSSARVKGGRNYLCPTARSASLAPRTSDALLTLVLALGRHQPIRGTLHDGIYTPQHTRSTYDTEFANVSSDEVHA